MIRRLARRAPPLAVVIGTARAAILTKRHVELLEPDERRRLVELVRGSRGRPSRLSPRERDELRELVAKLEPMTFGRDLLAEVSPLPIPRRRRR